MTTLPGWAIDLATDGLRGNSLTRAEIVTATRRVMLSAHRNGWRWSDVHALLTDTHRRRLASQIATGRGGRTIDARTRERFLNRHWTETARLAQRPAWSREDALGFIGVVQDALDSADLAERDRCVVQVVLDLANQHGTSRPAVPVRVVADKTGLSKSAAQRQLARLANEGEWLTLAQRGEGRQGGRASLYALAPALAATYRGASPPESQRLPESHAPRSHEENATMDHITLSREQIVEALGEVAFAALLAAQQPGGEMRRLRAVDNHEVDAG